jgi:hypothetical protein
MSIYLQLLPFLSNLTILSLHYVLNYFVTIFNSKSILSDISKASHALLWLLFAWNVFSMLSFSAYAFL